MLAAPFTVHPAGYVQLYPDASGSFGTANITLVLPGHTLAGPDVKDAGTAGFLVINRHHGALVEDPPQPSDAVTQS